MIGSKFSRHFFNQSEVKPKPIVARACTISRALCRLRVITLSFDWFTGLSGFGFTTLNWNSLYHLIKLNLGIIPRNMQGSKEFQRAWTWASQMTRKSFLSSLLCKFFVFSDKADKSLVPLVRAVWRKHLAQIHVPRSKWPSGCCSVLMSLLLMKDKSDPRTSLAS